MTEISHRKQNTKKKPIWDHETGNERSEMEGCNPMRTKSEQVHTNGKQEITKHASTSSNVPTHKRQTIKNQKLNQNQNKTMTKHTNNQSNNRETNINSKQPADVQTADNKKSTVKN